jgi:hypothetical protein
MPHGLLEKVSSQQAGMTSAWPRSEFVPMDPFHFFGTKYDYEVCPRCCSPSPRRFSFMRRFFSPGVHK